MKIDEIYNSDKPLEQKFREAEALWETTCTWIDKQEPDVVKKHYPDFQHLLLTVSIIYNKLLIERAEKLI